MGILVAVSKFTMEELACQHPFFSGCTSLQPAQIYR